MGSSGTGASVCTTGGGRDGGDHIDLVSSAHRTYTVGLIGLGYWGGRQLSACQRNPWVDRILVWDPDDGRVAGALSQSSKATSASGLDDCVERSEMAIVCAPAETHPGLTRRCLGAGLPTLVEKPLATTLTDCVGLFDVARDLDRLLMVGHQYRHHAGVEKCREFFDLHVRQGPVSITTSRIGGSVRHDADVLLDLAVHDLTVLRRITGSRPAEVAVVDRVHNVAGLLEAATLVIAYTFGVTARVHVGWAGPRLRRVRVEAVGDHLVLDESAPGVPTVGGRAIGADWCPPLDAQLDHFVRVASDGYSQTEADEVLELMAILDRLPRRPVRAAGEQR